MPSSPIVNRLRRWFQQRGWEPFAYQQKVWEAQLAGESGMVEVPTGSGKTYAVALVPLLWSAEEGRRRGGGPTLVYVTPLRAIARDIRRALEEAASGLSLDIRIETRTGDTPQSQREKQARALPDVLITTPESLSLLISRAETEKQFGGTRAIVLDEWHELLSTKRGVQAELCARHLESRGEGVVTWALTATVANTTEASQAAVGTGRRSTLVRSTVPRPVEIEAIVPDSFDTLPWAGHLGLSMLPLLLKRLDPRASTLIFTNTRNQAERWYQALMEHVGGDRPRIALHHGSIDAGHRREVEEGVRSGGITWVVATSSLDLGIDFHPVEVVVQVGSPKGIARALQRAGRSGHEPRRSSRLIFVPTHGLELVELEAVRRAVSEGAVEPREAMDKPYDVLAQHLVTLAAGPGFEPSAAYDSVTATYAYRTLGRDEFERVLRHVRDGGESLSQYPEYRRVVSERGRYRVADHRTARLHRASIGTITSQGMVRLQFTNRKPLGAIEEAFAARLRKGNVFHFAGRTLELVMMREGVAYVRGAPNGANASAATWVGAGLPYSQTLAAFLREELQRPRSTEGYVASLIAAQAAVSAVPARDELLVERLETTEAEHLFLYPFAGARVHEVIGSLMSHRLSRLTPRTLTVTANDYGIELRSPRGSRIAEDLGPELLGEGNLEADLDAAFNATELARRRFRSVAQIAGLVFPGYPGSPRGRRELQASATLFYEVFRAHDPDHVLLDQAEREVREDELLVAVVRHTMRRLSAARLVVRYLERPGPLAFPLLVKELAARVSSESLPARVERMKRRWSQEMSP